jgi:hypothetical protein
MKTATKGAKPEWLVPPAGVVTANVCRMSGKLATEGCEHADVIDDKGRLTQRSMVYTEYFARGTQPTTTCDIHASRGIFGSIAAAITGAEKPPVPHVEETGLPPASTATSGTSEPVATARRVEEPPKKKRGFWSRVLGIGRDDNDTRDQKKDRNR